ncbi:hypothetical protein DICVIV_05136 [Dictyocaulus viviparus]|uniref:Uncharacterized protein n=1 Tax=Dictyocaulus viviparus TaxID=29172 RepID=A0A0D8XY52_DICVI|nr:hypothetical protein DICVIV_05136 [Dictyocaulus viviparus]
MIDTSLNDTEKLQKIVNLSSSYIDEEPHSRVLLEKLVLLKSWLDNRLQNVGKRMRSIHEKKFKLLFVLKGSPYYRRLVYKAEQMEEEQIEKEFHEKAEELGINETIELIQQRK